MPSAGCRCMPQRRSLLFLDTTRLSVLGRDRIYTHKTEARCPARDFVRWPDAASCSWNKFRLNIDLYKNSLSPPIETGLTTSPVYENSGRRRRRRRRTGGRRRGRLHELVNRNCFSAQLTYRNVPNYIFE